MFIPKVLYGSFSLTEFPLYSPEFVRLPGPLIGAQEDGKLTKGYESLVELNRIPTGNDVLHLKCTHFPFTDSKGREWMSPGKVYVTHQAPHLSATAGIGWPHPGENYFCRMECSKSIGQQNPNVNRYTLRFECVLITDSKPYSSGAEVGRVKQARWSCYAQMSINNFNDRKLDSFSCSFPDPYRDLLHKVALGMSETVPDWKFGSDVDRDPWLKQWTQYFIGLDLNVQDPGSWVYREMAEVTATAPSSDVVGRAFILGEPDILDSQSSPMPFGVYHFKALRHNAYLDALDHVPMLSENSVSNILEIVGFMKALIIDHKIEIPRSLQSAWLSYRYTYNTTKADVNEAINFVHRTMGTDFFGRGFTCYGSCHHTVGDTDITGRCRITLRQKELSLLEEIWSELYKYGLSPSFYMFWDMVPYSFIVDWFIPVGDILSAYDKTHMYDRTYDITNIWFSIKYTVEVDGFVFRSYTRWHDDSPPEFNGFYTLENKGTPSDVVMGYRVLDTLSLAIK